MTKYADAMQAPMVSYLNSRNDINYKKFWITNAFIIYDATEAQIKDIQASFPYIEEIYVENIASIEIPVDQKIELVNEQPRVNEAAWNIEIVNATDAWEQGYNGTGFVVGNIDTGVRWTHEALAAAYRGVGGDHDYNWHDPRGATVPFDNNGHGTHVMGSMVGSFASGIIFIINIYINNKIY
jgi:subtilisin family serine protease